ncbi:MAG: hypothetical protein NXI13_12960 [Proteobacteria bacterium]|nr:hypothetical protein [Pseudomonadota bacterium]
MYVGSLRLALKLYPYILFAVFAEIAIQALKEQDVIGSGGAFASFFIWSILACYAHISILLPEKRDARADNKIMMGFVLRNLGLTALFLVPSIVIIIFAYNALNTAMGGSDDEAFFTAVGMAAIPIMLIFLFVYSLLGTLLPAYVAGRNTGIGKALRRGRRNFFPLMGRLVIGPGILYLGPLIIVVTLSNLLQIPEVFFNENWVPNFTALFSYALIYCFQGWAIVMIAWILSYTFLASEAEENTADQSGESA